MGFFKKLFKRKKGGTFFGNLLRKGANVASGGILGNGAGLANWEAKQAQAEMDAEIAQMQEIKAQQEAKLKQLADSVGSAVGGQLKGVYDANVLNGTLPKQIQNQQAQAWLKRNWYLVAVPVVALLGGMFYFANKSKSKRR